MHGSQRLRLPVLLPLILTIFSAYFLLANGEVPLFFDFPIDEPSAYVGQIPENSNDIILHPKIKVIFGSDSKTKKLCGFTIHSLVASLPFEINITDAEKGLGKIVLLPSWTMDKVQDKYIFQIEAHDCDAVPHYSERVFVTIEKSKDVSVPKWSNVNGEYTFIVLEAQPPLSVVNHVSAQELAVAEDNPDITLQRPVCKYEIISPPDVPFTIDENGFIQTTKVLHNHEKSSYDITVKAEGCTQPPKSSTARVHIKVEKTCVPGWTGLKDSDDIQSKGLVMVSLWPEERSSISLDLCGLICQRPSVATRVSLNFNDGDEIDGNDDNVNAIASGAFANRHIDPTLCDLTEMELRNQRFICGASTKTEELLPTLEDFSSYSNKNGGGSGHTVTRSLIFDGVTSFWRINEDVVPANHQLGNSFTMAFWMRHGAMINADVKEQILCNADGENKNRHHYSLFIQNCHLVFLLRREFNVVEQYTYSPAQWRYGGDKMKELLCDQPEKWHHFSLTMASRDQIDLFVDGEYWQEKAQVEDDIPLHLANASVKTTVLTVGSCYEGRSGHNNQYFRGELAGFTLLRNDIESPSVMRCLANCGESLRVMNLESVMQSGTSVSITPTRIQVDSSNVTHVVPILKQIRYTNTNRHRTSSSFESKTRQMSLTTSVRCLNGGTEMNLPAQSLTINLLSEKKKIEISIFAASQISGKDFGRGLPMLDSLRFYDSVAIQSDSQSDAGSSNEEVNNVMLDSCVLRVEDKLLTEKKEYLIWSPELAHQVGLLGVNNSHGLVLEGLQPAENYARVLRTVMFHYVFAPNQKQPVERSFGLACSQNNGEHITEEKTIKMILLNSDPDTVSHEIGVNDNNNGFSASDPLLGNDDLLKSGMDQELVHGKPHFLNDGSVGKKINSRVSQPAASTTIWKAPLIILIVLVACGLLLIALVIVNVVRFLHRTPSSNYDHSTDFDNNHIEVRSFNVYRNPMETAMGEPLVERAFVSTETPYCPVDYVEENCYGHEEESETEAYPPEYDGSQCSDDEMDDSHERVQMPSSSNYPQGGRGMNYSVDV